MIFGFKIPVFIRCLILMLVFGSCKSPLSDGKVEALSLISAKIEIYQRLYDRKENHVTVSLYDKDQHVIDNKDIVIKVNGIVLDTVETKGLYYTTSNFYAKENVPVNDAFRFEIILTDQKTYPLGSVAAITESDENNISLPEQGDFDKDLIISWHDLNEINELSISQSVLLKTSTELEKIYPYEPEILQKISTNGSYTMPKSSFITSKHTLSGVELKFKALKFGQMNTKLLKNSEIKIYGDIERYVDFDEEKQVAK